jgi:bifunctional non-homologous end joining protein LigD
MSISVRAGQRTVKVSRPEKPLFPCGITKAELACYYERVAGTMLVHLAGRPLNLERFPNGIRGQRIMQQRAGAHFPDWIKRVVVPSEKGSVEHVVADDAATLVYLADQACITPHRWLSRSDRLDRPDQLVIDLDPSENEPAEVRRATRLFGQLSRELELEPFVMSTGSRGYHVVVPLVRRGDFDEVRRFARDLAALASAREPRMFTTEQRKSKRQGRILIDIMRNAFAHTAVAPYAVRPRPGAPVATPMDWDELSERSTRPDLWTLRTVPARLERDGDPWKRISRQAQTLGAARRRLGELHAAG